MHFQSDNNNNNNNNNNTCPIVLNTCDNKEHYYSCHSVHELFKLRILVTNATTDN